MTTDTGTDTSPIEHAAHRPDITAYRCEDCGHVDPVQPDKSNRNCTSCGSDFAQVDTVVCISDREPWPCRFAEQHLVYPAVEAWAHGDYGFQAAAAIVLDSRIAEKVLPVYLVWSSHEVLARIDFAAAITANDQGELHLSGSARFLLALAANIAHGTPTVDLRDLWSLDPTNRRAVVAALVDNLRVGSLTEPKWGEGRGGFLADQLAAATDTDTDPKA